MSSDAWRGARQNALSWIESVSDGDDTGYDVPPMPDKVFVLHPLFERLDSKPINDGRRSEQIEEGIEVWVDEPDRIEPSKRRVRWADYARREGVPMFIGKGHTSGRDALPGVLRNEFVYPPDEGEIGDPETRRALFDILIRHSADGPATSCTAVYYWFWVGSPAAGDRHPPNVLRGPLHAWEQLFDRPGYILSPQNLWPDNHMWVLETHVDSWATAISGPTALIDDLVASPDLEATRLPYLG